MATEHGEERLLRSVALQNAESILQARQRAEDELRRAKEALEQKTGEMAHLLAVMRATMESTTDGILVTDGGGRITNFNQNYLEMWDVPQRLVENGAHWQVLEETRRRFEDPERFMERIDEIYAKSPPDTYDLLELKNRKIIERISRKQFVDEVDVGRVWSFRDVTQRTQLEETRFRLAAIVESSDDAIVSKTLDGIVTSWNAGAQRLFGYAAHEVVGRSITILIPRERHAEETTILGKLKRGERIEHYETIRMRKDGSLLNVSLTVSPIRNSKGVIIGASKIARDITEQTRTAAEREQLLIAERAARAEAERVSVLKDEFLATVSHELRSPLNAILGWSQLIARAPLSSQDLKDGVQIIAQNARSQAQLIEDLLDMSRIISGKMRLDVQQTDLTSVVKSALTAVRPSAAAKGIRLRPILDPQVGPVTGDPNRLQQVVWNLVSNAVKFTPKGGHVDVLLQRVNSHLEITVSDSGIGISPSFLPYVFDRFRQGDASTTRRYGGLGLGLSIVKQLVELHGGTVHVTSLGVGQGATFVVNLPLAPIRDPQAREHPATSTHGYVGSEAVDLTGIRVLVVDDEADARELVRRVLEQCNAEVFTASCAVDALKILTAERPDVLVSDIGMPSVDGYAFLREVRRLPPNEGGKIPAIALTAFARSEDRTRAMVAGYQMHIAKPIEPHELLATVASFAGRTETNPI